MLDPKNILKEAQDIHDDMNAIREHIHSHPELSFQETETSSYISKMLVKWGISYTSGWGGGTGIVAVIEGGQSGPTIGLRADIDALPIHETNQVSYRSKNEGVMHACGHDVHTTCLLGALRILKKHQDSIQGKIIGVFQPGEEKLPGGAKIMLEDGLLEKHPMDSIFCLHVHPPLPVGQVGIREGMYMASADEIYIKVQGKGGHGALPHNCTDTVLMTSRIVTALQDLAARNANPIIPSVLTFGKMYTDGGATNVIPDTAYLEGTFRTLDEQWRKEAHALIKRIASHTAESMGGSCEVDIKVGYPYLHNDEETARYAKEKLTVLHGSENVIDLPIRMTAEDFAYYSHKVKAVLVRLGTNDGKGGKTSSVHTSTFDIDKGAIDVGIASMVQLAIGR